MREPARAGAEVDGMVRRKGSRGSSMVEMLVVAAIVCLTAIPVLSMALFNLETTRLDRVRFEAESLCHNTLERFGESYVELGISLVPAPGNPRLQVCENPEDLMRTVYFRPGHLGLDHLVKRYRLRVRVEVEREVAVGLDRLSCRVTWLGDRSGKGAEQGVEYSRLVLRGHYHDGRASSVQS